MLFHGQFYSSNMSKDQEFIVYGLHVCFENKQYCIYGVQACTASDHRLRIMLGHCILLEYYSSEIPRIVGMIHNMDWIRQLDWTDL